MHDHHDIAESTNPSVLYLGADPDLPARIAPLLAAQGIALFSADDRDGQASVRPEFKYQSLILDMTLLAPGQTLKTWLDALAEAGIQAPHLVIIAATKDIGPRLQALRANAAAYFVAPVATDELLATLVSTCQPPPGMVRRVLVVDDDAMQALLAERILTAAGFQVRVLTDPLRILEILAAFQPHLVLMDLNMPAANGGELATIIREHDQYQALPILFLSVERDPGRQLDALSMGGDAFITKPIRPDLLVKTVTQRIDSSVALRRRFNLISRAEKACAEAQRGGGDRIADYQPSNPGPGDILHEQRIDKLIELALADSTPDHGFRLFYQPLVAVGPQVRHCLEVLLRLTEPDGSLVPSWDFLPIAERTGRAVAIDHWVMERALAVIAQQSREQPDLALLISQHLETLTVPRSVLALRDRLVALGLAPQAIVLGLAISNLFEHRGVAMTLAKMLRAVEIKVCLLDVDQTPVAFDLVAQLQPAMVRLAIDTVRQSKPERLNVLVRRLREKGAAEVIAAGIDDPALIGPVWTSGIDYAQGTLIQPPLVEPVFDWDEVVVG
ncbi:EAL domain-containing protein [uncultured Thiodictyon sp.]|uniref:EAL domain-containing protein n=1 Tax=uncultured Thiodictyon sp. TaxID=1846217 RepID=UPI0025D6456C|nr:EAL domain-containing protein [uncultured Thiodictyon sp.]